jgi:hypothetical protein
MAILATLFNNLLSTDDGDGVSQRSRCRGRCGRKSPNAGTLATETLAARRSRVCRCRSIAVPRRTKTPQPRTKLDFTPGPNLHYAAAKASMFAYKLLIVTIKQILAQVVRDGT